MLTLILRREIANKKGCAASQLCLAWVLAQGDDFIPIPGTKKEKYLRENLGALDVVLTKEDIAEIDAITEQIKTVGDRSVRHFIQMLASSVLVINSLPNRYPAGMQVGAF